MIAVSISPIPLGNASPKPPPSVKTSEISPTLPGQHHLQADIFSATDRVPIELGLERKPGITTSEQASGKPTRRTATVVKNDSLSTIFKRLGLPQSQLYAIMNAGKDSKRLKHLRPGQTLEFEIDKNGTIKKIIYRSNWESALEIALKQGGKGYRAQMIAEDFERRVMLATGTINRSLFLDGQRAGLSDKTIMQMVKIFAWDVDFALNVRPGDRFSVIYEQLHRNGEKIRTGNILAAEFINRGKTFRALRYENDKGKVDYYTPEGRGMRKAFLRTPVEFSRISSRFQLRRMHPVLNRVRAHRGVDYAAPRGTPIKATAQGKVTFIGRKGGLGKAIFLQHRGNYTTVYGHMHKYARGIKRGKSIRQGQTIGYVGSTGLATGPHLHYEFRVRGVHKDPLKVKLPQSQPIEARYRADFRRKAEKLIVKLNILSRTRLASRE
uniref:Murein DD-endopeptidase MepM and murein hydrolase activator NlpD, contain LysM domain n=1 Tax=Candidatus Kentrum sp. SD TaxID=2126332 RepID=A0A451BP66_9GAMM|nr:MAG: Murein DD-endopeptidase MepM and murein hydrolase activator NlpD, contain LysM domain [Candidatus Kentron sp. SD]VFK47268.1 MAG: Murein DD-endopeptidase MepM and murein hydrolase activator NlpD, contain LysM domain [Candidatus Kentron sp. SD]VFK80076.1 MAG: Murein DD-endopeptidase MepM and murein hydrolase activator NlpD, contain LysM domain [Candidatus Kentron sp. SD]